MASFTLCSRPPISLAPSLTTKPTVPAPGGRVFCVLPESRGLRIHYPVKSSSKALLESRSPRVSGQRGVVCEAQETSLDLPTVTDATWESEVLKANCPVVVDFWAPWCGPCRLIEPVVSEIAQQYAGKLKFVKLNTDLSPSVAGQYGVRSIPTIMIFVNGEKKEAIIGAVPKTTLTSSIEKFL